MDRFWLLTWTTYGTWLPGDDRGFVSNIDRGDGKGHRLNKPGTKPAAKMHGLTRAVRKTMTGSPVFLSVAHAWALLDQFHETGDHRGWQLEAVAIMRGHIHMAVGVPGDPDPETLLRDFKSYGSRKLNRQYPCPTSGTWWTESGSRRKLPTDSAVAAAVAYVRDQENPLVVWLGPRWRAEVGEGK